MWGNKKNNLGYLGFKSDKIQHHGQRRDPSISKYAITEKRHADVKIISKIYNKYRARARVCVCDPCGGCTNKVISQNKAQPLHGRTMTLVILRWTWVENPSYRQLKKNATGKRTNFTEEATLATFKRLQMERLLLFYTEIRSILFLSCVWAITTVQLNDIKETWRFD